MNALWKPGDRALCVDDSPPRDGQGGMPTLCKGTVYLVNDVSMYRDKGVPVGGLVLHLAGQSYPKYKWGGYCGWIATRFRRIVPACDMAEEEKRQEVVNMAMDRLLSDVLEQRQ